MLQQNAHLTASHPYATGPINWPFLLQGISFWTGNEQNQQIYMIGNLVSWWGSILSVSVFLGVMGADSLARRRGIYPIPSGKSSLCALEIQTDADELSLRLTAAAVFGTY